MWLLFAGGINQLNTLPLSDQIHVAMSPHMMNTKSIISFPFDVSSPTRFYHNNAFGLTQMDMIQRTVVNNSVGIPFTPNKRQINCCNICQLFFNSQNQAETHYRSNKHARMVKGLESKKTKQKGSSPKDITVSKTTSISDTDIIEKSIQKTEDHVEIVSTGVPSETLWSISPLLTPELQPSAILTASTDSTLAPATISTGASGVDGVTTVDARMVNKESDEETAMKLQYCSLCKVGLNSLSQLQAHNKGTKHKTMLAVQKGFGPIKVYPKPHFQTHGQTKPWRRLQDRIFHCRLCDVCVNSEMQLKQHISSRRHKDRVAGKTPKPKPGPKKKLQLNVQAPANELQESVEAGFLPNPLTPAMTTVLSTLPLRPAVAPTIFQAPPITLLQAMPGPVRIFHRPILFTPY
ncbi:zinc finger protein 385D-like [Chiloscyllium plagiosum]|uniref:zinc finger protein 385D-like n=1 Tax=Chiloscyllium plagiosum TaxID=36176 RepID=UPI001CB806F2|nr:zinc finger protein 385D-like [Chiloscyllium plagiosum]